MLRSFTFASSSIKRPAAVVPNDFSATNNFPPASCALMALSFLGSSRPSRIM